MADVLLDCDGVLLDLTPYVLDWLGDPVPVESIRTWDFFSALSDKHAKRAKKLMGTDWFWRGAPTRPGAKEAVAKLRELGHTVCVLTSPWRGCKEWGEQRYQWLWRHFHIHDQQVAIQHEKWRQWGHAFVDDKLAHVEGWQARHPTGRAFLCSRPGNADIAYPHRIDWTSQEQFNAMLEFLDQCCHDK